MLFHMACHFQSLTNVCYFSMFAVSSPCPLHLIIPKVKVTISTAVSHPHTVVCYQTGFLWNLAMWRGYGT